MAQSVAASRERALRLPNDRWRPLEIAVWLVAVATFFLLPGYLVLGSQILIVGMFAVTLDLILGYAGIVSLGHAAFFGVGAYTAGLLAVHGFGEPISGLLAAAIVAGIVGYLVSFLVVRGSDLTRLMVTLGIGLMLYEAANKAAFVTGGVDGLSGVTMGKVLGVFDFDLLGRTTAQQVCEATGIDESTRVRDLTDEEVARLRTWIDSNLKVEGDLRRDIQQDIKRKMEIGSYQGIRHRRGLPVRGQRTHTNARTRKGKSKGVMVKKKPVAAAAPAAAAAPKR